MKPTVYSLRSIVSGLLAAFTLVELMVVVAIISILLMLLIPNIRTMREKAWSANCQNNLRQYGVAMNQYMSPGSSSAGSSGQSQYGVQTDEQRFSGISPRNSTPATYTVGPPRFRNIVPYLPDVFTNGVTIQSLSDGQASVRVCPVVMQQIKREGNFFDPKSPNYKGNSEYTDQDGTWVKADFEAGSDGNGNLILSEWFSTYAINNWAAVGMVKSEIPENVIAYIDWNAKEGWGAAVTNGGTFQFSSPDGLIICDVTKKTPSGDPPPWWLTEVGFHHLQGNVYGANYVAMDGHVGWVGSNTISVTNFTTGL